MAKASRTSNTANTSKKAVSKKSPAPGTTAQNSALLDFFTDEIKDIYWAEKHLTKTLPKMQKAAVSEQLVNAIADHLLVTKGHVTKLEEVFALLGKKPQGKKCDGMEGLVKEGEGVVEDTEDGSAIRDVGIIISSQKVEHYEIAAYGSLTQLARVLALDEIASILAEILAEEIEADDILTQIAENNINYEAETE